MKFNYADSYPGEDNLKWLEFDSWLEELSEEYPDEFAKDLYTSLRFMTIGIRSSNNSVVFVPADDVPEHIQNAIRNKLLQLWRLKG